VESVIRSFSLSWLFTTLALSGLLSSQPAHAQVPQAYFEEVSGDVGLSGDIYSTAGDHGLGVNWIDYDKDQKPDLFVTNGLNNTPHLFHNDGGTFTKVDELLPVLPNVEMQGSIFADFDNDGDLDILATTNSDALTYYRNDTVGGNWLRVTFDTTGNPLLAPDGFGTRVFATIGSETFVRYVSSSPSYLSVSEPQVHFGLGAAGTVDELRVQWPRGYVTVLTDVPANIQLTIDAPPLGDLDADGVVGIADFLDLLAAWGACIEDCCLADLDLDGDVGITDFLLLLDGWG